MSRGPGAGMVAVVLGLGLAMAPRPSAASDVASRTFEAPLDRVWTVTESVLKRLGWDVDTYDRAVGWILTDARAVDSKEFPLYGRGLRHKLRISLKTVGPDRTLMSVERDLYEEKRVLWMIERKPVPAADQTVESGILDAVQQGL